MKTVTFSLMAVGFIAIVIAAFSVRSGTQQIPPSRIETRVASKPTQAISGVAEDGRVHDPVYADLSKPASSNESAQALHEASVRAAFIQFRTASASGNRQIRKKLLDTLRRHQDLAVRVAEQHLATAKSPEEIADIRNAIQDIRR